MRLFLKLFVCPVYIVLLLAKCILHTVAQLLNLFFGFCTILAAVTFLMGITPGYTALRIILTVQGLSLIIGLLSAKCSS